MSRISGENERGASSRRRMKTYSGLKRQQKKPNSRCRSGEAWRYKLRSHSLQGTRPDETRRDAAAFESSSYHVDFSGTFHAQWYFRTRNPAYPSHVCYTDGGIPSSTSPRNNNLHHEFLQPRDPKQSRHDAGHHRHHHPSAATTMLKGIARQTYLRAICKVQDGEVVFEAGDTGI